MDMRPSPRQQELVNIAYKLAVERFAPRAAKYDREAAFPAEDYADLRASGLLALCVPEEHGGLGAGFETYCLVAEQLARGNASTALTFNMHSLSMLMMAAPIRELGLSPEVYRRHQDLSARRFRQVVEEGVFYAQPHSEPVESGSADQLDVGGRRFGTRAQRVNGGYLVNGRKFFVSSAGAADYYATPALLQADGPWETRTLYLAIPRGAPGVEFVGEWDPMGLRATVSRDMNLKDVWVPADAEILPPGVFGQLYQRHPHLFIGFSATFLGLMQAAYDFTIDYLTGQMPATSAQPGASPAGGDAVAEMLFTLEATRALYYRAISEEQLDPPVESTQRARAAHVQVQRSVVSLTGEAIRVCGGRATLKRYPLERYYRDARAAAVMRPWTQEVAVQQAGETALAKAGSDASAG
ncbi:MAG: acyl-CoA/acyl-ACP dehydrogenase [Chloroflexi bacterium]|nr:acyl-CoA/acyl-ACP dehydrogenase [Chloroflexota bacterium]